MSYLLASDLHFHAWSTFAETDEKGRNTRLMITVNELKRACEKHISDGGDKILIIAGDVFHTRGSVKTTVINIVSDLFSELHAMGFVIHIIPGNHDLESADSHRLSSAVTSLESSCKEVYHETTIDDELQIVFVPWFSNVESLKAELEGIAERIGKLHSGIGGHPHPEIIDQYDLIIHAPVDNVIIGLPSHGLDATYLRTLGFKRVFSGHYHNHKDLGGGVYSIGASTHQTFSDVGSKAGTLSVGLKDVKFRASHAPKFVDINSENFDDAPLLVDGNYVRCKINISKESDVIRLKKQLMDWGAKGIVINQIKESAKVEREGSVTASSISMEESIIAFIKLSEFGDISDSVEKLCLQILKKSEEVIGE